MGSKLHGVTITSANLEYHGSLSIDAELMRAAGIWSFERIDVYNMDNGERLTTYAIPGAPGEICLNGAAAHKGAAGQRIIIATYVWLEEQEIAGHHPTVVIADKHNGIAERRECDVTPDVSA